MSLPIVMSELQQMTQMQNLWSAQLNPVLNNSIVNGRLIRNQTLITGSNVVNHGLGRNLIGWFITRLRGSAPSIYDTQDSNQLQSLTLNLNSSGNVVCDIYVF